jgi:hypothetical protein
MPSMKFLVSKKQAGLKNLKNEVVKMINVALKISAMIYFKNYSNTKTLGLSASQLIKLKSMTIMM